MSEDSYRNIQTLLASAKAEEIHKGLELVRSEIARIGSSDAQPLFEMISTVFYIDPLDRPDLMPVLNEAVSLVVDFGKWIIPVLLETLDGGDMKAQLAVGHALGHMGSDAIEPLIAHYESSTALDCHTFILYALGKIKSPKIVQAIQLALEAARSTNVELRDTATRAIGKFVESIPPLALSDELRQTLIERLRANLGDSKAGIRAKAIRSLGKLAKYGHLTAQECEKLKASCSLIMGTDENFEWDRAYIVRKEAEETLRYL